MATPTALGTVAAGSRRIDAAMTPAERRTVCSSFSQRIPQATPAAKNYLRALLGRSADAELVADLRAYFNSLREGGHSIYAADVSAAIRLLKGC